MRVLEVFGPLREFFAIEQSIGLDTLLSDWHLNRVPLLKLKPFPHDKDEPNSDDDDVRQRYFVWKSIAKISICR